MLIFNVDLRRKIKLKLNVDRQNRELEKKERKKSLEQFYVKIFYVWELIQTRVAHYCNGSHMAAI